MNREIKFRALDENSVWWYFTLQNLIAKPDAVTQVLKHWCEYTGLKDKNGKEIFEGDIVQFHSGKKLWIAPIVWRMREAMFVQESAGGWGSLALQDLADIEIIGNIYENPELLTN